MKLAKGSTSAWGGRPAGAALASAKRHPQRAPRRGVMRSPPGAAPNSSHALPPTPRLSRY